MKKHNRKYYGYNCTVCGESIKEPQPTEHTDDGLAHAKCCEEPKAGKPRRPNTEVSNSGQKNKKYEY